MSNSAKTTQTTTNETNSDIEVFTDIVDKYRNADKGDKARIRANTNKKAMEALSAGNFALAAKYANTANLLVPVKSDNPVNYGQIVANLTNVLNATNAAIEAIRTNSDITVDWDNLPVPTNTDKVDKFLRSVQSVKSDRRDIQGVYDRAFADDEPGTVRLVADIAARGRLDDYQPGSGAVAARLRGDEPGTLTTDCTLDGYQPVWLAADGTVSDDVERPSSAYKVAARKA